MTNAIDDLFDTAAPATPSTADAPQAPSVETPAAENSDTKDALYPNVLRTLTSADVPAGENPPGTLTIPEFAGHLTVHNVTKLGQGPEGYVDSQKLYQAVKGKRWALPVVLVLQAGEDGTVDSDPKNAKVFIPVDEALAAWADKPATGTGGTTGSTSTRAKEDLLDAAWKNRNELQKAKARAEKLAERIKTLQNRDEKYDKWLTDRGFTWEEANELAAASETAEATEAPTE